MFLYISLKQLFFNGFDWFVSHSSVVDNKVKNSVPCFLLVKCSSANLDFTGEYFRQAVHAGHKPDLTFGSLGHTDA